MKNKIFLLIFIALANLLQAQIAYEYTYDIHGNRISRRVITIKFDSTNNNSADSVFVSDKILDTQENDKFSLVDEFDNIKINLFPNPAKDFLNVEIISLRDGQANVCLYNETGQLIFCKSFVNKTLLQLSGLTPGVYLVKIRFAKKIYNQKIIKQ